MQSETIILDCGRSQIAGRPGAVWMLIQHGTLRVEVHVPNEAAEEYAQMLREAADEAAMAADDAGEG